MPKSPIRYICLRYMRHIRLVLLVLLIGFTGMPLGAYMVKYKEDYYKLYHVHYASRTDDYIENIYWLEKAVQADFCNPQYAYMTTITTKLEWEKYRYLFMLHLNLKLSEQHLRLGNVYDKTAICFYDAPWKDAYISDLEKTLSSYKAALVYWEEAKLWSEKAEDKAFRFINLKNMDIWQNESRRIATGDLDLGRTINRELTRVEGNLKELKAMEPNY